LAESTPFPTTDDGFLKVNDTYQCIDYPGVFAAGDCCGMIDHPRPKAGVFAVRAGPPLRDNLVAFLTGKPLTSHQPQQEFLGLISTGDKYAVASRGFFAIEGAYLWRMKDNIDRKWMEGYTDLPSMDDDSSEAIYSVPSNVMAKGAEAMAAFSAAPMRCGGCGAKVGATTVSRVLDAVRERRIFRAQNGTSKSTPPPPIDHDDAAVVMLPKEGGGAMVQTIDFFRSFVSDPFIFGKIAAVHALSDCHAMGANAQTALALAVVPYAAVESITESTLLSMLSGASDALESDGCDLVGGHTCEGAELALGFSVNGYVKDPTKLFRKRGGKIGDKIVLTKPIGTGALFAADMRVKCKGPHVESALESMCQSNGPTSRVALEFHEGVHACTDVTGFGLAGHLLEMLVSNDDDTNLDTIGAIIDLDKIPYLEGGLESSTSGIYSSLHTENYRSRRAIRNHVVAAAASPIKYPLIFDPQTAGGLLFFVSPDTCEAFVKKLQEREPCRESCAAVIGEIVEYSEKNSMNSHGIKSQEGVCTIGSGGKSSGQRVTIRY